MNGLWTRIITKQEINYDFLMFKIVEGNINLNFIKYAGRKMPNN